MNIFSDNRDIVTHSDKIASGGAALRAAPPLYTQNFISAASDADAPRYRSLRR